MELEEGSLVLCTVDRIVGTVVFVKIEGEKKEGNIILSEIAPGRIRNLREYVVPKKKIVCKVLRISPERIDLSLRRVSQNEKKQVIESYNKENSYESILKSILGDSSKKAIDKIREKETLYNFFEQEKQNPKQLEKIVGEENAVRILQIINKQKIKKSVIKKEFSLNSAKPNGLELLKKLLGSIGDAEINYISAGKFSIKSQSNDLKKEEKKLGNILIDIEKKAKENGMEFSMKAK
ncbi:hypothetical protein J4437_05595 [Candidatus Woesearchaeota archaeon]|nr:hypothetical protein [Candidatus Woesearchaeota archaeon]